MKKQPVYIVAMRFGPKDTAQFFEFPELRTAIQFADTMRLQGAECIVGTQME
jgi:hypothetical protein